MYAALVFLALVVFADFAGANTVPRDCEGWRAKWFKSQRLPQHKFQIDPDGHGGVQAFYVSCDMSTRPATTIIDHNYVGKIEAVQAPSVPDGIHFPVIYGGISMQQIVAMMNVHGNCRQHLKYECHGSVIIWRGVVWGNWFSRTGRKMPYFPGGPTTGRGCSCGINKSCAGGSSHLCNCDKNDFTWRSDEGSVTDKNLLPISKVSFSDTDNDKERGFFTLGPLRCMSM